MSTFVYSVHKAVRRMDNEVGGLAFHVKCHVLTEHINHTQFLGCLLYTSDAADE